MKIDIQKLADELAADQSITDYDFWRALKMIDHEVFELDTASAPADPHAHPSAARHPAPRAAEAPRPHAAVTAPPPGSYMSLKCRKVAVRSLIQTIRMPPDL